MPDSSWIGGPAWKACDFSGPRDWCVPVDPETVGELRQIVREIEKSTLEISALTRDCAPLPGFRQLAGRIRDRLRAGYGFLVLQGIPLDEFTFAQARILYAALGLHLGEIVPQTVRGDVLYSVRDEGVRLDEEYGRPGIRTSKTNIAFDFHTDSPSRLAGHTPDYVALFVLRPARSGGESVLVSAQTVHDIIAAERPEYLRRLYQPFWVDRRAELPPGEEPVLPVPVFERNAALTVRYLRFYITKGHALKQEPLQEADLAALDFLDSVMARPGIPLIFPAERGDIQIINNKTLLHGRSAFEDHPEPEFKRHYLRMWLEDPELRGPAAAGFLPAPAKSTETY